MPETLPKNFDLEKIFTRKDYAEFHRAVTSREEYEFRYGKTSADGKVCYQPHPSTGIGLTISGRKCDNGVWKDNYLYSIDHWRGNGGGGCPYDPVKDGILTYEEVIDSIYRRLDITPPQAKQLNIFDFEM